MSQILDPNEALQGVRIYPRGDRSQRVGGIFRNIVAKKDRQIELESHVTQKL